MLVDSAPTGDPVLDSILEQVAAEPVQRNAQYWIERLAAQAESIIDRILDRLVDLKVLEHHDGDFWTLAAATWHEELSGTSQEGTFGQFIKVRVVKALFTDDILDPRDVIVICLVNTCDVFRFIFELDEQTEERIEFICQLDLIGRSIGAAVEHNIANPLLRRSTLTKKIPVVALRRLVLSPHLRSGNIPALFADLTEEYGPVFRLRLPFGKPMTFLSGPEANKWVNRHGRMHLRAGNYFAQFEQVYGAHGVMPSLDGADHFRLRRAMGPAQSRGRLCSQLDEVYRLARALYGGVDGRKDLPGARLPTNDQRAALAPLSRRRFAGHHRRPDGLQGAGADHSHHEHLAQVHAEDARNETAGEDRGYVAGADPGRPYAGPARRLPAQPRRRLAEPARERSPSLCRSRTSASPSRRRWSQASISAMR